MSNSRKPLDDTNTVGKIDLIARARCERRIAGRRSRKGSRGLQTRGLVMSAERQSAPAVRCGISCVGDADAETARMEELRRSRPRPSRTQTSRRRKRAMAGACWTSTRSFEVCRPRSAAGVHAVHGSEICDGRKIAEFPAGGVRWRRRPLRIGVWDETSAVRALRKAGMESFCAHARTSLLWRYPARPRHCPRP